MIWRRCPKSTRWRAACRPRARRASGAEKIGGTDMNRKLLKKLALSGFVLGVATGCSGMGKMADAPSRAAGTPALAAKSADKARAALEAGQADKRSAEQPSELPSLMRISYSVFCLKKK